ncbi:hypothetical protein F5X99DRAFT_406587 [Biscogniauxia marginata]|nr:hypothetical protein F5X99DRAFT_406587 [Biscogniauxia marginata]
MKALSGMFSSWSHWISQCCNPVTSHYDEKPHYYDTQKSFVVIHDEPSFIQPPSAAPLKFTMEAPKRERAPRKRRGSGWGSYVRKRLLSSDTLPAPRRPQISAPSNFRHLYSESFSFPDYGLSQAGPRPASFRPLELNLYITENKLSPILPHFDYPSPPVTPPPRAYTISTSSDESPVTMHQRNYSSISFHVPRRPVNGGSVFDSPSSDASTPQRPRPARVRAQTPPSKATPMMEDLVERVANAMLERDRLQDQIDDVMERQSIYVSSRPSTAYGPPEMEPMPEIPALPPNAPSFSERLGSDRPQTAPSRLHARGPYQANSSRKMQGHIPPPPLPLRLRPPLRKKKSFSQVSAWLFPGEEPHNRDISLDSLTNAPRPVTGAEGFYQIAEPDQSQRCSFDSESTVSDWSNEEEQTIPTSLSPSSSATPKALAGPPIGIAFGPRGPIVLPQRRSVGVAV